MIPLGLRQEIKFVRRELKQIEIKLKRAKLDKSILEYNRRTIYLKGKLVGLSFLNKSLQKQKEDLR